MATLLNSHKPSIVFFGNERLATGVTTSAPVLRALIDAGYPIEAVIVNHVRATSRKARVLEIEDLAIQHNIPVLTEFSAELTSPIAVLAAYGRIVPKSIINHFAHGIINLHPSALPKYRGSTPLESVILDGSKSTMISLMQLDVKMDAGAVFAQQELADINSMTKQQLVDAAGALGATMLLQALPQILDGSLTPQPQNEAQATYTQQITKADGQLDFTKTAQQLEREVRAYAGWPGSSTEVNGKPITVTAAEVINQSGAPGTFFTHEKQLAVYCAADALLITQLKPAGKRTMPSRDFLAGNPIAS